MIKEEKVTRPTPPSRPPSPSALTDAQLDEIINGGRSLKPGFGVEPTSPEANSGEELKSNSDRVELTLVSRPRKTSMEMARAANLDFAAHEARILELQRQIDLDAKQVQPQAAPAQSFSLSKFLYGLCCSCGRSQIEREGEEDRVSSAYTRLSEGPR